MCPGVWLERFQKLNYKTLKTIDGKNICPGVEYCGYFNWRNTKLVFFNFDRLGIARYRSKQNRLIQNTNFLRHISVAQSYHEVMIRVHFQAGNLTTSNSFLLERREVGTVSIDSVFVSFQRVEDNSWFQAQATSPNQRKTKTTELF